MGRIFLSLSQNSPLLLALLGRIVLSKANKEAEAVKTIRLGQFEQIRMTETGRIHRADVWRAQHWYWRRAESANDSAAFVGPNCSSYAMWTGLRDFYLAMYKQISAEYAKGGK